MSRQYFYALQSISVPNFNSIISETGNDLLIIVLQAVDAFRILASTIYSLKIETAHSPIVIYTVDIFDDFGIERSIEIMIRMTFARSRFEEVLYPVNKSINRSIKD